MAGDDVKHRIDHTHGSAFVKSEDAFNLGHIGLIKWHHNEFPDGEIVYVYRAVTHYDEEKLNG